VEAVLNLQTSADNSSLSKLGPSAKQHFCTTSKGPAWSWLAAVLFLIADWLENGCFMVPCS
jgi:hypothetical protein